jgi:Ribonuclease G/E
MSGLRGRLKRLERDTVGEKMVIECPTCGMVFTLYGDPAMDYLVLRWRQGHDQGHEGETHGPPADPDVVKLAEHEHDPGAFVEKSSGLPFLSREVSGMNLGGSEF